MGFEVCLQAIREDSELVSLVRQRAIDVEFLTVLPSYFRERRELGKRVEEFSRGDKDYERFVDAAEQLIEDSPGIESRCCDLDRRFDWLGWLLLQCACEPHDAELTKTAIAGEREITEEARSVQGFPIRWTTSPTCDLVNVWLQGISSSDVRSAFDPDRMREASLYKWTAVVDFDAALLEIVEDSLGAFYSSVASNSDAVLVVKD